MATDTDIRGVQTPDPIPLPDAAVLDGSASLAEFVGLLRDQTLTGSAAATAAQSAAEAAAAAVEAATPEPIRRGVGPFPLALVVPGGGNLYELARGDTATMVERICVVFGSDAVPIAGDQLLVFVYVEAPGTRPSPGEGVVVDGGAVDALSFGGIGASVVFEPPVPYYVPAGSALLVQVLPAPDVVTVQWSEVAS